MLVNKAGDDMLEDTRIGITNHALDRYRERINPDADRSEIRRVVRDCRNVGSKMLRNNIHVAYFAHTGKQYKAHPKSWLIIHETHPNDRKKAVFACVWVCRQVMNVVTCWLLDYDDIDNAKRILAATQPNYKITRCKSQT